MHIDSHSFDIRIGGSLISLKWNRSSGTIHSIGCADDTTIGSPMTPISEKSAYC
jgi:hypothetical protein